MNTPKSIKRMQSVQQLIDNKMLVVDTNKFQVAMLAELWNLYSDEGKLHLCRNIMNYCKIKNSFDQLPEKENPVLLISIKDSSNEVAPYAYFRNDKIDIIKDNEVVRNFEQQTFKRMKKVLVSSLLILLTAVLLLIYFI